MQIGLLMGYRERVAHTEGEAGDEQQNVVRLFAGSGAQSGVACCAGKPNATLGSAPGCIGALT